MRPPRMTTRRWMALVAVVGLGLVAYKLYDTRKACLRRASSLATLERQLVSYGSTQPNARFGIAGITRGRLMAIPELLIEIAKVKHKYEHAARHPWLPVWPDPREPPEWE